MEPETDAKTALVLTGGGARGAYQAGVLRALAEATRGQRPAGRNPFAILCGTSAGAINAAYLASQPEDFDAAVQGLWDLWKNLAPDQVVDTRGTALTLLGLKWLKDLSTGGLLGEATTNHLLDATPLRHLLEEQVRGDVMAHAVRDGLLDGISFTTTHYATGTTVVFHNSNRADWQRSTRIGRHAHLSATHVAASAAIPFLFAPVDLDGSLYGDGGVRDPSPLSPAIHMGAARILAVGIRYGRPPEEVRVLNMEAAVRQLKVADIAGVLLNSVFLDGLEADVERLQRINGTVALLQARGPVPEDFKLRQIPSLAIQPSRDLGGMAAHHFSRFPFVLRRLLRGIGASDERGSDLLSYLSFDSAYTVPLLELGYADGMAQADQVRALLYSPRA